MRTRMIHTSRKKAVKLMRDTLALRRTCCLPPEVLFETWSTFAHTWGGRERTNHGAKELKYGAPTKLPWPWERRYWAHAAAKCLPRHLDALRYLAEIYLCLTCGGSTLLFLLFPVSSSHFSASTVHNCCVPYLLHNRAFERPSYSCERSPIVDVGHKIVSGTLERYRSPTGTTAAHHELENLTTRLKNLIHTLDESSRFWHVPIPSGQDEADYKSALRGVLSQSRAAASELLAMLADVKASGSRKFSESAMATVRARTKEKTIKRLQDRLGALQNELSFCLTLINGQVSRPFVVATSLPSITSGS